MIHQAPIFSDAMAASQDWVLAASGFGSPDPFAPPFPAVDEFERQRREIDLFLHLQNEKLKHAIEQQRKQHMSSLMKSLESRKMEMMNKTERELAEATTRARELEDCLRRAEMETEAWERVAKENEAVILGLNNMLGQAHQAQERLCWASSGSSSAQDAESACGGAEGDKMGCKWCRRVRSCVVFFPCRHLCACRECGALLGVCPVCQSVKEGSIEVFMD